jgi:hypothetical protein
MQKWMPPINWKVVDNTTIQVRLHPQLATLELIVYPTSAQLQFNNSMTQSGALEIVPMEASLMLFIWGQHFVGRIRLKALHHFGLMSMRSGSNYIFH